MQSCDVTPLVLTFNEAPNLRRTLEGLRWANEVIVVDSFSTDDTESIARSFDNVRIIKREFDNFAGQCNFGLNQVRTDWVLSLDADYVVTQELSAEIAELSTEPSTAAYFARFRYCVAGRALRGSLYPPRAVLFRTARGKYLQDGHAHRLTFEGGSKFLQGYLLHDDRKPLARWLESQRGYARLEAAKLIDYDGRIASLADHLRRWIWPAAPAAFIYTLLVKRCLFDGWAGWFYALQRTYAELLLSLEMLDRKLQANETGEREVESKRSLARARSHNHESAGTP